LNVPPHRSLRVMGNVIRLDTAVGMGGQSSLSVSVGGAGREKGGVS
jgi:hypothetical protein